jgi:hypothetical protein
MATAFIWVQRDAASKALMRTNLIWLGGESCHPIALVTHSSMSGFKKPYILYITRPFSEVSRLDEHRNV